MQRVQKILSNEGYCSRRKAETLIEEGKVKVNGRVIRLGDKAAEKDKITVEGKPLRKQRKTYIIFHKPIRCVTAVKDPKYETVMDHIKVKERVYPVGRLDYNTSGLLILTNDGDLANRIMHPKNEIKKTYVAELARTMSEKDADRLRSGIMLSDGKTHPAKVNRIKNSVEITIHEGRNRIVRRMLNKLGYKVKSLQRTAIGNLRLSLKPKQYKKVTKKFIENLI